MKSEYNITKTTLCNVGTSSLLVGVSAAAVYYVGIAASPALAACLYMFSNSIKKANKESSEVELSIQQLHHTPMTELSNIVVQDSKVTESKNEIRQ